MLPSVLCRLPLDGQEACGFSPLLNCKKRMFEVYPLCHESVKLSSKQADSVGAGVVWMWGGDACVARVLRPYQPVASATATAGDASVPSTPRHPPPPLRIIPT